MRHPSLRILLALVIGGWSILCCCKVAALAGDGRGGAVAQVKADTCCQTCDNRSDDDRALPADDEPPVDNQPSLPGGCPTCPSCQPTFGGAALKLDAKMPSLVAEWNFAALATHAALLDLPPPADAAKPRGHPPDAHAHLKSNRDVQRWHCALIL